MKAVKYIFSQKIQCICLYGTCISEHEDKAQMYTYHISFRTQKMENVFCCDVFITISDVGSVSFYL